MAERAIWKFVLPAPGTEHFREPTLSMPEHAEILCTREQFDRICIWAAVDPNGLQVQRRFHVSLTGYSAPSASEWNYIGAAHLDGGAFIAHVFTEKSHG